MADEQNSQGYTVEDLGKAMKQKNPGKYDGWSDADVGSAIQQKHPGKYDQFKTFGRVQPKNPAQFLNPLSVMPSGGPTPPPKKPSVPRSFYQDFIIGRPTGREWAGMAVDALPAIGAGVAAAAGPPGWAAGLGMAALGGAVGQAVRHGVVAGVGPDNLSGPTTQVEPPPSDPMDFAFDVATEGGKQALFELGGRALSGLVGGPLHAAGAKAENAVVKELSQKYNLGLTPGQVSNKFVPKIIEKMGDYGLISRGYIQRRMAKSAANGLSAINQVLDRLHPPTSPAQAGESVKGMFKLSKDLFSKEASHLYWDLDQEAQGVMTDMSSVKTWAKARLQDDAAEKVLHPHGGYNRQTLDLLGDAAKQPDAIPFSNAQNWRSYLMKITPQPNQLLADETRGIAKQLVRDTTGAMEASSKSLNPKAHQLWVEARQFYKDGAELFDHEVITGMMKKDSADVVHAIKPKIGDTETASRIRSAILDYPAKYGDPADVQEANYTWRQFQEQFVRSRLLEDPEHTGMTAGVPISAQHLGGMKERIHEFGPGVMGEIFGRDAEGKVALKNLTDLGEAFSRIDKLPDQTRMILYRAIEAGGVFAFGGALNHPVSSLETLAGLEVVPMLVSGVVHNKQATAYMLEGLRGLTEEALKIKPTSLAGRTAIKVTNAVNTPNKAFAKATADIGRAASLYYTDREKMQQGVDALKQDKPNSTGVPPGPPKPLDIFKGWQ